MAKKVILTVFCACLFLFVSAQDFKMHRVSLRDVTNTSLLKDTSANALFLYKWKKIDFEQNDIGIWETVTKIRERIKIFKKEGIEQIPKTIVLKNDETKKESIDKIKIIVYYLENGKLKSKKIDDSELIKHKISSIQSKITLDFSEVETGSIIDINYTIHSPFYTINDLIIQEDIPTNHFYASVAIPSVFNYKRALQGNPNLKIKEDSKQIDLNSSTFKSYFEAASDGALRKISRDSVFQVTERIVEYELSNIKALKKESYSPNLENHRWVISYELLSANLSNKGYLDYSSSWVDVIKQIYKSKQFSDALSEHKFLKNIVSEIENDSLSQKEMVLETFNYVKDKMVWNKKSSIFPESSLENTFLKKTGNVADVNLFLVALLKACGFKAYPILATTKNHPIRRHAKQDTFNYVIAYVELDYEDILLDATEKNNQPNFLPERVLDVDGTLIYAEDDYRNIDLFPKEISHINSITNFEIFQNGNVSGHMNSSISNMDALTYRNKLDKNSIEKYKDSLMINNNFNEIENFNVINLENLEQPIIESYDFKLSKSINLNSDKISISPLFFLRLNDNPFKEDERSYPINFAYKQERKRIINIKTISGFEIKSLPQSVKINLPVNIGYFQYQISKTLNGINLVTEFKINQAVVPSHFYLELKSFFDQLIKKESEKIVLEKI